MRIPSSTLSAYTYVKIEYNVAGVTEKRDSIIIPEADIGTYDVNVSDEKPHAAITIKV